MNKIHIVITGRRNVGKSSLINCILQQKKAIVSDIPGTTTDPVKKSYELPGIASLVLIDTAGIDDEGELGTLRIKKTEEAIQEANVAILVISHNRLEAFEERLILQFKKNKLPFLIIHNQSDLEKPTQAFIQTIQNNHQTQLLSFSTLQPEREKLIQAITELIGKPKPHSLLGNLIHKNQTIMLVTPIDSEAPTGRLILPQVQILRDILDHHCISIVLQPEEITTFFANNNIEPDLVITDSQLFKKVASIIPQHIPLTSFSIILAHHKGNFQKYVEGTPKIEQLQEGDRILMLESCSHHVSCEDIGRVKIPALLKKYTGKQLQFDFIAGLDQIERPISDYALIIQCGGCMVTSQQLHNRLQPAIEAHIPISNYGMTIAYVQGIFHKAIEIFIRSIEK